MSEEVRGLEPAGAGVTGCGCLFLKWGPLQVQYRLLTAKPSLQTLFLIL